MPPANPDLPWQSATFRFYGPLADFLPPDAVQRDRPYRFKGTPSVKDAIEAQGVPHTEVELILADDIPASFGKLLGAANQRIAVYPAFHGLDLSNLASLRDPPPQPPRFALDVNVGKLARWLRLLGFDATFQNDIDDRDLVDQSVSENRILLTRDRRLLFHKELVHAYCVRSDWPEEQVAEVVHRYGIEPQAQPFRRCTKCNGRLRPAPKAEILHRLEPLTKIYYTDFFRCSECQRLYWRGSHHERLLDKIRHALHPAQP